MNDKEVVSNTKFGGSNKLARKNGGRIILFAMIGAGKSTIADLISRRTGKIVWTEPVDNNPILRPYYEAPEDEKVNYANELQTFFLTDRYDAMMNADYGEILDRSLIESYMFAKANYDEGRMNEVQISVYENLYNLMQCTVRNMDTKYDDLLVFLDIDFDTMMKHINLRGRDFEKLTGDKEHDDNLIKHYENLLAMYKEYYTAYKGPKMRIDMNNADVVFNEDDKERIIKSILDRHSKIEPTPVRK